MSSGERFYKLAMGKEMMMREPTRMGVSVDCNVCGRRKAPHGRSVADAMANSLCDRDCAGYLQEPMPGCLWPGETDAEFGFMSCEHATRAMNAEEVEAWKTRESDIRRD